MYMGNIINIFMFLVSFCMEHYHLNNLCFQFFFRKTRPRALRVKSLSSLSCPHVVGVKAVDRESGQ
jgi:hypothetical protein